jgi:hypothetical protein
MDLFSFLSFHFICVTVTVVTGHFVALSRRSHLFSTMSSLHDVIFARCISARQPLKFLAVFLPNSAVFDILGKSISQKIKV